MILQGACKESTSNQDVQEEDACQPVEVARDDEMTQDGAAVKEQLSRLQSECDQLLKERVALKTILEAKIQSLVGNISHSLQSLTLQVGVRLSDLSVAFGFEDSTSAQRSASAQSLLRKDGLWVQERGKHDLTKATGLLAVLENLVTATVKAMDPIQARNDPL